ncbi:diacylglycerol kinase family protein [Paenibacillus tuaregi]|uniref:diacylglycerol kinase family protein n=1 Tax=Paenibacillus tuaregi TaxID=1816681 RepID=UPI000838F4FC|nr:diacylglycerol kinase family protein [Paenibacillus tuaregi]
MRSRHKWSSSFRYAFQGITYGLKTQRNLRVHVVCAVLAAGAAAFFHLSAVKWAILLLTIAVVIAAELINTAVESAVDLSSPELHPLAKAAKDTAAGAVLVCAIFAVIIGIVLFYDPVTAWLSN